MIMAASKKHQKFVKIYVGVSTVAFSVWMVVVGFKLVVLAGHFVTTAYHTVVNSIPLI